MTTLVVYREDNLANPAKLLTHFEDIQSELERLDVLCRRVAIDPALGSCSAFAELPPGLLQSLQALQLEKGWDHAELYALDAIPVYALPDASRDEPEHSHPGDGARCLLTGGGILCLRTADMVLAIGCQPGDVLGIPAGMRHWFRPRPGRAVTLVRLAAGADALARQVCESGLASVLELPDL